MTDGLDQITLTPNLKLSKLPANFHVWAEKMNNNLQMIDASVSTFVVLANLKGMWSNSTVYAQGDTVVDSQTAVVWQCQVAHTSAASPTTFTQDRNARPTLWSTYSAPATARGIWTPNTQYRVNDFVTYNSKYAVCIVAHTSTLNFDADVASGKWSVLVDLSNAGAQVLPVPIGATDANKFTVTNSSGLGYSIVSGTTAMTMLGGVLPISKGGTGTTTAQGNGAVVFDQAPTLTNPKANTVAYPAADPTSVATAGYVSAAIAANPAIPTGVVVDFAGAVAPSGWLLCQGQAVSRTTYNNLYTALGGASSPWGQGDGSTTFNVPDYRARMSIGVDPAAGTGRVTSGVSGIASQTLAATGGDQNMPTHAHGAGSLQAADHSHYLSNQSYLLANQGTFFCNDGTGATYIGYSSTTVTNNSGALGVTGGTANNGAGGSLNMPPTLVVNKIIKT